MRHTDKTCEIVPTGDVNRLDQDGSRCAKGEVALKFVVKVNPAQEIRTLCGLVSYFYSILLVPFFFIDRELDICWSETHHRNPNVNPLARQELKHHRSLRREHTRILRLALLHTLFLCRARAILEWLTWGCILRRWSHEALGVRGWAESVGLCEDAGLGAGARFGVGIGVAFAGFLQGGAG